MPSAITSIRLVRFRGFANQPLKLRPLTVLLGPNSAGKSSFGQALAALKQVNARGAEQPDFRDFNPDDGVLVDVGEHADLAHAGSKESVQIHIEVPVGTVKLGFGGADAQGRSLPGFPISYLELPKPKDDGVSQTVGAPLTPPAAPSTKVEQTAGRVQEALREDGPQPVRVFERDWTNTWAVRDPVTGYQTTAALGFQGLRLLGVREATGSLTKVPFEPVGMVQLLRSLERAEYLQASRLRPHREYQRGRGRGIGSTGEHTPFVLLDEQERQVPFATPPECPATPEAAAAILRSDATWHVSRATLLDAVGRWMQYLDLARAVVPAPLGPKKARLDVTLDAGTRALTEVGFGLSQVLPILVAGLCLDEEGILIVEQPEAQLHPRPQAALADFFCFLAKTGRSALVETHSEAFFHRLRMRVALDDELAANIAVYALDPPQDGKCGEPRLIDLGEDRETTWPKKFMTDGVEEALSLLAARAARHRRDQPA